MKLRIRYDPEDKGEQYKIRCYGFFKARTGAPLEDKELVTHERDYASMLKIVKEGVEETFDYLGRKPIIKFEGPISKNIKDLTRMLINEGLEKVKIRGKLLDLRDKIRESLRG